MTRDEILNQLASLLPAQFEELLYRLGIPREYLSSASGPQTTRAVELISYLEARKSLEAVVALLDTMRGVLPLTSREPSRQIAGRASTAALRCFVAHAHRDRDLLDELRKHLSGLIRSEGVEFVATEDLAVGASLLDQVAMEINRADLILLLVSPDYLAAKELYEATTLAILRSDAGAARVVPIIARPTEWSRERFAKLSALPRDGRAITARTDRDSAWVDVVQGLQLVLKDLRDARATEPRLFSRTLLGSPPPSSFARKSSQAGRAIGDIFRTTGTPQDTFVEPDRFRRLRIALATMGKGLVVEGPSGIGKSVAVKKALAELGQKKGQQKPVTLLNGVYPPDVERLSNLLKGTILGHLVVDDFHRLDASLKTQLAKQIKYLADSDQPETKITLLGVNQAGMSLTAELPDLAGRVDIFAMGRQPDAKIEQLIEQGEHAANLVFVRRSEFVLAALGSFYTAQQLCLAAAERYSIEQTMDTLTSIDTAPRDLIPDIMMELDRKFTQPLLGFAALDQGAPQRGACLSLLWLLSRAQSGYVLLNEAHYHLQRPELAATFAWLGTGALKQATAGGTRLADLLFYDAQAQLLSIEDPRLEFYLRNLSFEEFGRRAGLPVEVRPDDHLVFRT